MEAAQPGRRADLLNYLTEFIGRRRELQELGRLLAGRRLLTLTGPGGSGKTRLALAAAADVVHRFPGGVGLVELAALSDPDLTAQTVATALGLREQPDSAWETLLVRWLQPKQFLLLLDNCEHLLDACATLADALLRACPDLTILATSREALRLAGEVAWPTPPLSLPAAEAAHPAAALMEYDAICLFVERAQTVVPDFCLTDDNAAAVAALCRQLDGIPLAIELAAARIRSLAVTQILQRLDHSLSLLAGGSRTALPRQQTMHAAIDWSYRLLDTAEASLFRRLAVFAGGFTLTAVESICFSSLIGQPKVAHSSNLLDLLTRLIDKSLVVVIAREPEARYRLLETVRHFAWEALNASGELDKLRQRHAEYYLRLAETAEPNLRSANRPEWLERLEAERDNLRDALHWLRQSGQLAPARRLAGALIWFWYFAGVISSAAQHCRTLMALADKTENADRKIRARLAWGVGATAWIFGDYPAARDALEQSQQLARSAGAGRVLAYALTLLGLVSQLAGDDSEPDVLHHESVALFREAGDQWGEALALYWLGDTLRLRREYAAAQSYYEQSQAHFRQLGDPWGVALALQGLGSIAYRQGELAAAQEWLAEGLALRRVSGDRWLIAQTLSTLATVLAAQGETGAAKAQFEEAVALYQGVGDVPGAMYSLFQLGQISQAAGETGPARDYYQACLALAQSAGHQKRIEMCRAALAEMERPVAGHSEATPALEIFAFGGAVVYGDGAPIAWPYARVRELFFYLLHHQGQTKEQIGVALWPDATPERLRRSLQDTLYRLRRALGDGQWVVYEDGRYYFNRTLSYWYDVETFRRYLVQAQQEPAQAIAHLQAAAQLVQGEFLAGTAVGDWSVPIREGLRQEHLDALLQLGQLLFASGRFAEAAGVYRQTIAHDNLLESAHREVIRCYLAMGRPGEAAQQYHLLLQLLADELGMAPAPETTALFAKLI